MDALLAQLSSTQFNEWGAFLLIEDEERQQAELAAEAEGRLASMKGR